MTDDLDARLAALNARRRPRESTADSPARRLSTERDSAKPPAATPTRTSRLAAPAKRRHAAPAARILTLGLSVSATLAMVGVMSRSLAVSKANAATAATVAPPAAAPIVVHVVLPDGQVLQATNGSVAPSAVGSTPIVTRPAPAAPTTTRRRAS